jgi:hypothetical protein
MEKLLHQYLLLSLVFLSETASFAAEAPIQLLSASGPQHVFGGGKRTLPLQWRNFGEKMASVEIQCALFQASSGTVIPVGKVSWKNLSVLPGQTVLESALLEFPTVRSQTDFILKWVDVSNTVLGATKVAVYPTNLLSELGNVAPIGVYDPSNVLKPLLRADKLEFVDLEESESFTGKLVIALPAEAEQGAVGRLRARLKSLAGKGAAAVLLQTSVQNANELPKPSYYLLRDGRGSIVVAQASAIADLANDPLAQLRLLHFARLALHPETLPVSEL